MPQTVIDAFGGVGTPVAFLARTVLPGGEEGRIDLVAIGINQALAPAMRDARPEQGKRFQTAVAYRDSDNLPRITRRGNPKP